MAKQQIHLICNAHLDPVWLWKWQEGAAEAISTFRTAAELCEKHDAFIFNHNEVILYQWIQEYEPQLFERIRKLVKQGRWHIMGGWYLQPDCNMLSGESFVRQILVGKNYFKQEFGVEPNTAINFDPFGHTQGLVQIMAKSGYDSYLFGRPTPPWQDLPAEEFTWVGLDGSKIMATRFCGWYQTFLGQAKEIITERIEANPDRDILAVLWGVGNHGGGPSKYDLKQVEKLIKETDSCDIQHSTPEKYFKALSKKKADLPEFSGDLYPWGVGCYTSQIRIKQGHRLLENEYYATEKMLSAAYANKLLKYPADELSVALEKLLTVQFHDILPGSSIEEVEKYSLDLVGAGLDVISRLKMRAFFNLASGQKKAKDGYIPVMVYNPHPFETEQIVECEFNLHDFKERDDYHDIEVYQGKKSITSQVEYEASTIYKQWRKHLVFNAMLKPGMNRFDCLPVKGVEPEKTADIKDGKLVFINEDMQLSINTSTGLIDSYIVNGKDCLGSRGVGFEVLDDSPDSWLSCDDNLGELLDSFKLASSKDCASLSGIKARTLDPVRVIEAGDVRTVVEACFKYNRSFMFVRYYIPKIGNEVKIDVRVNWNENDKALKMAVDCGFEPQKMLGDTAFGCGELVTDGRETVSQKWTAVLEENSDTMIACVNNGTYGADLSDGKLRPTLLRSACYSALAEEKTADHSEVYMPQDRLMPRFDNGVRNFSFWLSGGNITDTKKNIHNLALLKNEEPLSLSFFPNGDGAKTKPIVSLSNNSVQISAVKKSEKGNNIIIRLYEPVGDSVKTTLKLPVFSKSIKLSFDPFEIKTIVYNLRSGKFSEKSLIER
ncbi:MAG: glycoside hydrolase family 38 C-terminal domain-containing protein [Sedimentisphaeraceae bacterium JB056]